MYKMIHILAILLILGQFCFSQDVDGKVGVGLKGGVATYFGDINDQEWKPHFGLSMDYWMTRFYSIGIESGITTLEANKNLQYFKTQLFYISADIKFKLVAFGPVHPYFLVGVEGFKFDPMDKNDNKLPNNAANNYDKYQFGTPLGGGLSFFLGENLSLDLQGVYHYTFTDYLDDLKTGSADDSYITSALKLTFYFGGEERDSDGDGIPDKIDRCPNKKEDLDGYEDEDGCPDPDNDKDGILDVIDKCPNKAEDIDGFKDKDGCPDPDNDGDGIPDVKDKCPGTDETVAKGTNTKEDLDGFQDDDGCPDPDNDGDGILDINDKCPNKPETFNGWEDEDGCPDEKPKVELEKGKTIILKGIYFRTGSAELDPNSEDILDDVAETLQKNPQIYVEIRGYTDNTGGYERNIRLSKERAETVKMYLMTKGIDASRLTTKGFGPEDPVASNATKEGRAKNRRIEFFRTQ